MSRRRFLGGLGTITAAAAGALGSSDAGAALPRTDHPPTDTRGGAELKLHDISGGIHVGDELLEFFSRNPKIYKFDQALGALRIVDSKGKEVINVLFNPDTDESIQFLTTGENEISIAIQRKTGTWSTIQILCLEDDKFLIRKSGY